MRERRLSPRAARLLLLAPGAGWLAVFMVLPCLLIFVYAFFERGVYGGVDFQFSLDNFRRAADPVYFGVFIDSARIASLVVVASVLIAYPAACAIAQAPPRSRTMWLFIVMLPFWSNYLIRTYAWIVLLNREGIIAHALRAAGWSGDPPQMLYSEFAVILGLVYNYLPFVILAIYASVSRLPAELREASEDLGASSARTFLRVTMPLTIPGVAAGSVFVFVLSIGNFITPDLLGGGRTHMVGNLIYDQFLTARDWPFGASLSMLLIAVMTLLLFAQAALVNRAAGRRKNDE